jgi:hypothetical protein
MIQFTMTQTWYTRKMSKSILLHEDHTKENVALVLIKIQCVHSILYGKLRTVVIMVIKIGREKSCKKCSNSFHNT